MEEAEEIDFASGIQAFESQHFSRAMQLLSPLAARGYADAQHRWRLGFISATEAAAD